jgi:hypothetical protein
MLVTTGCDERPTTPPRESSDTPEVDEATSQGTATTLRTQRSPAVLFAIRGGLVPLLCFDGARAASGEDGQDDGGCDAVVAAHEPSMLFGLVVFFPGTTAISGAGAPQAGSPSHVQPRVLSMMQFDRPRVIARTSIDGVPGDEIVLDSAFVEGIEDQTVTSAVSTRVVAWTDGAGTVVGSWGCRMF